ncbi:MAG: WGR domain-containing protein [Candidatus Thiodiazotropha lotti]|nr:WGR domain-containing protein [Candidatus Thiodiazotropha lotti]
MATSTDLKIDRQTYMERHDLAKNMHRFYQVTRSGNVVCLQWGRIETVSPGQTKIEICDSDSDALNMANTMVSEKLTKGYVVVQEKSALLPESPIAKAREKARRKENQAGPEPESPPEYYLQWKAHQPLSTEALQDAAALTRKVLDQCHLPLQMRHDTTDHVTRFYMAGEQKAAFGYPPRDFLESLSSRERQAVTHMGTSRDGWLAQDGTGQGIIVTGKELFDFPVRLFLSILATRHGAEVNCSDELTYGVGFIVPESPEMFAWYRLWRRLRPIVEELWFVHGSTRISFATGANKNDCRYAW